MTLFSGLRRAIAAIGLVPTPGPVDALYAAVVVEARRPDWYLAGQVPDTLDGRFDMVALVLALVMIRLEDDGAAQACADLTERFIRDMDGTLRQDGVGDQVVGKHIGRMVAALGGRLGAYRGARDDDAALAGALRRNVWRGEVINDDAVDWMVGQVRGVARRLDAAPVAAILAGQLAPVPA